MAVFGNVHFVFYIFVLAYKIWPYYENKTKQNKTKQLANACETITHSLVANAKAVTITLMLFFTMLVSPVVAQPPTLPDDYYDQAYMGDDADVEQQLTFENAFWQILYDSEIADCVTDNNIKIFSFITISGNSYENGPITPITVPVDQSNWSGDYELDVATLLGLAGLGSDPGTYFVSHMEFFLLVNGVPVGGPIYPGASTPILTGLPYPCDCLHLYFDKANHKLHVFPGVCNLLR